MDTTERIGLAEAETLICAALTANGVPSEAARSVAAALVAAEAEGQVGHGFSRLEDYIAQVASGKIHANALPVTRKAAPAALLTDAAFGFAYPALDQAIAAGLEVAAEMGTVSMAVTRSHHCGALSVQVERIARAGFVGLMFTNAPAAIAPWGGNTPVFGTNPVAFAAPRGTGDPLVIDLSLSRVARGKVMHARKSGKPIPEGWALDRDGQPTTDPVAALGGSMIPIGEAKGSALALMVEILAAVMTGAALSTQASSFFDADGPPPGVGQFLMALRPADAGGFADRMETLLASIEAQDGARLPGTRRVSARLAAERDGIAVPAAYLRLAERLADGSA
jgi:(2R)-3-sulfolactate dehydrogenase (NADP+)